MNLTAPQPTSFDIHFDAFGIPVRVSAYFWIMAGLIGYQFGQAFNEEGYGSADPRVFGIAVVVIFLSILLHELGHAVLMRYFGHSPSITLYHLGGLAHYQAEGFAPRNSYRRVNNSTWAQIAISFAGPGADFLFAGLTIAILIGAGYISGRPPLAFELLTGQGEVLGAATFGVRALVMIILYVNIWWGILNLVPVYPLDGGQIARELFLWFTPYNGVRYSLYVSIGFAGLLVLYGLQTRSPFLAIMFAMMAMGNYQQLSGGNSFGGRPW
ncbi:site-2 protease family protein [Blastopirellula sp. JC732]|uniref:Site-2 protease family protein n=1 Tax=Blastopirellula sediminis TaxID=2894196 RepID=A0A9X1SJ61_9BACT|nr:site-2 protease family protein [Blastopirellula sediminis]MCC9605144.1 site-2 protease family protein [Blastopirellula sediminis]MCC9631556.1 site-2 protease family protein [Blastopirellula sediminis]